MSEKYYTKYKLEKQWNYNLAEDEFVLYGLRKYINESADFLHDIVEDGRVWSEIDNGSIEWAKRTAKKFNIEIPE